MKVLKFYATWCGPCKGMSMMMESMENLPEIENIDIDQNTELTAKYGIRSVPTLIKLDDDGNEIGRYAGGATDRPAVSSFLEV